MSRRYTGFATLPPEARREAAAFGGSSVPAHKRAFYRDPERAKEVGRLGGLASVAAKAARRAAQAREQAHEATA